MVNVEIDAMQMQTGDGINFDNGDGEGRCDWIEGFISPASGDVTR